MSTMEGKIMLYRTALKKHWHFRDYGMLFENEQEPTPELFGIDKETAQIIRNHELNLFNNEPRTV